MRIATSKYLLISLFVFVNTDRYLLPLPSYWIASCRGKKKKQEKKSFSNYTYTFFL